MTGTIRIGIGGWTFEPWRGRFYPDGLPHKRELEYAAGRLSSIEVNGTYYGTQKPETFARWREETPEDFVFALKGPRFTTNRRVLAEAGASVERFLEGAVALGPKLGPINWQFMPTKAFLPEDFEAFLDLLPPERNGLRLRHAVELRHQSFAVPELITLARTRGVAIVIAGDSEHPQIADPTADFACLRIMGTHEDAETGYTPEELDLWATRARAIAAGTTPEGLTMVEQPPATPTPRDVFLYVISGYKPANPAAAMALIERLSR